ncbi:hypothetical protein IFR05_009428 [Cadophora sp. M221]|nr:hypothetical protein IFR05_009428 [Cadophora sp. M221]
MTKATREAFYIPAPEDQLEFLTTKQVQRFFASRLALPVIIPINDYNYNMNSVDRADQLRAEFNTRQATRRSWLPYFFWLLDSAIINAFLLWRWELESRVVGRQFEGQRYHRQFREFLVEDLVDVEAPASHHNSPIQVYQSSKLVKPNTRDATTVDIKSLKAVWKRRRFGRLRRVVLSVLCLFVYQIQVALLS